MRIRTPAGDIPYRRLTFPDGQRHLELLETECGGFRTATIEAAITSADVLFDVLLAKDVLDLRGFVTSLHVRYLLGARMDRRISSSQPATLDVVARLLNGAGFRRVRVLDPHSPASCALLGAEAVLPTAVAARVLARYDPARTCLVVPDAGATVRVADLVRFIPGALEFPTVQCFKSRNSENGKLSGFSAQDPSRVSGKECLILDDICDGGGTFTGLAEVLQGHGATAVDLFVTHGLFTRGLPLSRVRMVYTTDSLEPGVTDDKPGLLVLPVEMAL